MEDKYLDASRNLEVIERLTDEFFAHYDPDLFMVDDATDMFQRLSKRSRLFDAAKMRTARRLEKVDAYKEQGFKDPASWFSSVTGDSVGEAAGKLQTKRAVEAHPVLEEAFNQGKVSEAQAKEIASAADRCPQEADRLVADAQLMNHGQLKKICGAIRHAADSADDEITRHERIRKNRFCRTWTDSDGAGHLQAMMTPDALAVIMAGLGNFEARIFSEARKSGQRESHQAYLLDALVAMASASGSGSVPAEAQGSADASQDNEANNTNRSRRIIDPKALVRVRLDLGAWLRGYAILGETCEIPGFGPVPVAMARDLLGEALFELVITKGTNVTTVVSDSRFVAKALRIALEERDPVCVVPGCNRSDPLERDHWRVDYSDKGPTCIDNLARLCKFHHQLKTYHGWRLEGGPGQWRYTKPDAPPGADPEWEVTDTAEAREARREAAPANDPPIQEPLL